MLIPHFDVVDTAGRRVTYRSELWQRKYLLLVTPPFDEHGERPRRDSSDLEQLVNDDVAVVIAAGQVTGIPAGATVIVDRWGEIAKMWRPEDDRPTASELEEWMTHVRMRCPECEGEVK